MASRFEKGQIVYLCSLMVMVFVILSYLSIQQLQESNDMRIVDEEIEAQHRISQEIFKTDVDFFGYELNNREFYRTGKSIYLKRHDSLVTQFDGIFKKSSKPADNDTTETLLNHYDSAFNDIVDKIKLRGYEDFGLEGKMRSFAHELENKALIPEIDLLMLRRHEKDYLLRWNIAYVKKYDDHIYNLITRTKDPSTIILLKEYSNSFHALVDLSDSIGLETQTNLKGNLNDLTKNLSSRIEHLDSIADKETLQSYQKGMIFLSIGIILSTILCISLVVIIIRKM